MSRAVCPWIGCLHLPFGSARAETIVRTRVEPETAWVGERATLQIEVLSDQGWAQVSRFGEIALAGAYVLPPSGQGVRLHEQIDGVDYSGQGYGLAIYPQADGTPRIPPIPIEVAVRTYGADADRQVEERETPAATIDVRTPPGAERLRGGTSEA